MFQEFHAEKSILSGITLVVNKNIYIKYGKEKKYKPKSIIRDFEERNIMNWYQLLKETYYFTHYNCHISLIF